MQSDCNSATYDGITSHGDAEYKQNIEDTKKSTDVEEDLSLANTSYFPTYSISTISKDLH